MRSWGCDVKNDDAQFIVVRSEERSDYNAIFEVRPATSVFELLRAVDINFSSPSVQPTVLLGTGPEYGALIAALEEREFQPVSMNATHWSPPGRRVPDGAVVFVPVSEGEIREWSAIYSTAFEGDPRLEYARWSRRIPTEGEVGFFFLRSGATTIGTVQLCVTAGTMGIYSFGILPGFRGRQYALSTMMAAEREAMNRKVDVFYYERMKPFRGASLGHGVVRPGLVEVRNTRTLMGFRRLAR